MQFYTLKWSNSQSCCLQLISIFSSPFFSVKFVYNCGHRTQITVSCTENVNPQDDGSLEGFLTVHCIHATYFGKSWEKMCKARTESEFVNLLRTPGIDS